MEKNDGGPAFPTEPNTQPGFYAHHGMSLRDYQLRTSSTEAAPHNQGGQAINRINADADLARQAQIAQMGRQG